MHERPSDPVATCAGPDRDSLVNVEPEPPIDTGHHALVLLSGMEAMLRAIVRDVDAARERVVVETYIYRDDTLGRLFAEALVRAAARGVPVRLLYDPLGSQKTDVRFFDGLRAQGVEVRAYRPTRVVLRAASYGPRDHSRNVVIDHTAYTGGAAWGDEWLPKHRGGKGWHDVCLRVQGPVVEDFARAFDQRWREALGEELVPRDYRTGDRYPDLELVCDAPTAKSVVYDRHVEAVRRARARVWLESAYFFPPPELLRELYRAAARGVDVRVIVPGESDLPLLKRAARSEYREWTRRGLKIHEYRRCMLHSKFAVVDDDWCTVGTFNINPPSIVWANEANVFVWDRTFVRRLAALFEADLQSCELVTEAAARRRPILQQAVDQLANDLLTLAYMTRARSP